ncbi:MAG: DUF4230 domain-containing protein [Ekhidna sp.]|uniref:DUF4230 domain-containing protein n=1 Tax=Ekhidna sp. TaxID=2608089 RepID=UPI0032EAE6C2
MIYFLLKNWKLFLDIILVVGALIAFTLWDPIGMFTNARTKQTSNLVTGVRDIGQLVTAEYYGEVISSWKEFKLTEFPSDTLTDFAEAAWQEVAFTIWDAGDKDQLKSAVRSTEFVRDLPSKNAFDEFVACLGNHYLKRGMDRIYKDERLVGNVEQTIYKRMLKDFKKEYKRIEKSSGLRGDELKSAMNAYLLDVPAFVYDFFPFYQYLVGRELEQEKKKNIVFIGRGSVKAGFDFGQLDESNFLYEEDRKMIHFYGIKPAILDVDINPWFIPERKVKGFELVSFSGDVNFEEAKEVKRQCKQKLLAQARGAEILERAEANGKEALRNFFSLLLDEPDLQVSFHTHPYDLHLASIKADTLVDLHEAVFIDSLYQQYLGTIDTVSFDKAEKFSQHFRRFVAGLKKLSFLEKEYPFSYYSMRMAQILKDTFHIDSTDVLHLTITRDTLRTNEFDLATSITKRHSNWFVSGDFRQEWNTSMVALDSAALTKYDSTLNLSMFKYQLIPLIDSVDVKKWKTLAIQMPSPWDSLQLAEIDTVAKVISRKQEEEEKLRPLTRMQARVTDFIDRLKK